MSSLQNTHKFINIKEHICCWDTIVVIIIIIIIVSSKLSAIALLSLLSLVFFISFIPDGSGALALQRMDISFFPKTFGSNRALETHTSYWNCIIHWRLSEMPKYCCALAITVLARLHHVGTEGNTKLYSGVGQRRGMDATEVDKLLMSVLIFLFPPNSVSNLTCLVILLKEYINSYSKKVTSPLNR